MMNEAIQLYRDLAFMFLGTFHFTVAFILLWSIKYRNAEEASMNQIRVIAMVAIAAMFFKLGDRF